MKTAPNLRALIADAADTLASADYTETQLTQRLEDWQAQNPDADTRLQAAYQFALTREFSQALLMEVLVKMQAAGYFNAPPAS